MIRFIFSILIAFSLTACFKDKSKSISKEGNLIVVKQDNTTMKIDPLKGGRIVSYTIDGDEILASYAHSPDSYGSTFWPSPQSAWGWPPLASIDSKPYTFSFNDKKAVLISEKDSLLGIRVVKTFVPLVNSNEIKVIYGIVNLTDKELNLAGWEITRVVPQKSFTFFPLSEEKFEGEKMFGEVRLNEVDNYLFWEYDEATIDNHKKNFVFSKEGWLAFAQKDLLLIKQFEDVSKNDVAPNESEVELYANPNKLYIEIEQQGKYKTIAPNDTLKWSVVWSLHRLSDEAGKIYKKELIKAVYNNR